MTVSYNSTVSTSTIWNVQRLLLRWRGSVWQCVWHELLLWMLAYTALSASYRYAMDADQRVVFEKIAIFCDRYSGWLPVTFLLGFYVTFIVGRWWNVFSNIAFPDEFALALSSMINGNSEKARRIRRTTTRYLVLSQVLALRQISTAIFKRFPTYDHLLNSGLINTNELAHMYRIPVVENQRYWIPIRWIMKILVNALDENIISTEVQLLALYDRIDDFRKKTHKLLCFDWISIPLVYTQVVNLAVRSYLFSCLMGRQFIAVNRTTDSVHPDFDMYVPVFTILQFICFGGWLKVAEVLINPMGEDDEDFDLNYIVDRNLKYGLTIIDDNHATLPDLSRDSFWTTDAPTLPHTVASAELKITPRQPSTMGVMISRQDSELVNCATIKQSRHSGGSRRNSKSRPRRTSQQSESTLSVDSKSHDKSVKSVIFADQPIPIERKRTLRQKSQLVNEVLTDRRIRRGSFEATNEDARKRYNSEGEDLQVLPEVPTIPDENLHKTSTAASQLYRTNLSRVSEENDGESKRNSGEEIEEEQIVNQVKDHKIFYRED